MSFIHDAIDRRRCNTRGRPSTISVDHTNTPENGQCLREGTFPPKHFSLGHFPDTYVRRNTTRSANAAMDAREPISA